MDRNSDDIYQLVKEALHTFALEISEKISSIEERLKVLENTVDSQKVKTEKEKVFVTKSREIPSVTSEKIKTSEKDQKELIKALEMIDQL